MLLYPNQLDLCPHISGMVQEFFIHEVNSEKGGLSSLLFGRMPPSFSKEALICRMIDCSVLNDIDLITDGSMTLEQENGKTLIILRMEEERKDTGVPKEQIRKLPAFNAISVNIDLTVGYHTSYVYNYIKTYGNQRKRVRLGKRAVEELKNRLKEDMDKLKKLMML